MEKTINQKVDNIFKEIGEIGAYQILVVALVSCSAIVLSNADYSYNIYLGATPDYRYV
jgi:TRAP-type mannitol/chloroaromatic compound transport system permease small subunit